MKRYNTPHRRRVIKTRLTEEEYAEFSERVTLCKMSQSEYIRQALTKSRICPVITVSPVNDELLSAVGKLTAEYGKIGGNLNQIARCLNEYGAPYNALSQEVRAATEQISHYHNFSIRYDQRSSITALAALLLRQALSGCGLSEEIFHRQGIYLPIPLSVGKPGMPSLPCQSMAY